MKSLTITTLVENSVRRRRLLAEHGLSFHIETDQTRILFDTGAGMALFPNARELGVRFDELEAVVCSHGHDDHTGSLFAVLHNARTAKLCLHPDALSAKFAKRQDNVESIGIPDSAASAALGCGDRLIFATQPVEIAPGVHATGPIPRRNDFEDTGGRFFTDAAAESPDPLTDDQAVFIEGPAGIVVICGCSHSGVINTLDYVAELTGAGRIHTVLGGFHLLRASNERLDRTVQGFERHQVEVLAPCHCTGPRASAFLRHRFPEQFKDLAAGEAL